MTNEERGKLHELIQAFEETADNCRQCAQTDDDLCPRCWVLFETAKDFEEVHCKFKLNDSQIEIGFKQATGKQLDEDELLTFKDLMLQFECEDADSVVEAIQKVVMSLRMRDIGEWE